MRQVLKVNTPASGCDGSYVPQIPTTTSRIQSAMSAAINQTSSSAEAEAPSEIRRGGKMRLEWFPRRGLVREA